MVYCQKNNENYAKLLEPGQIGKMKLRNRTVMPAMGTILANIDQSLNDDFREYHYARAEGEIGLNVLEICSVERRGQGLQCVPGLWHDKFIPGFARLADGIHERGGKVCAQLHHAGRGATAAIIDEQPVAPSAIRAALMQEVPRALKRHEVVEVIDAFGDAARRAQIAGVDCVEIHGGHGYLVFAFLTPLSNKRTDEYGGSFENRVRFLEEIIINIKKKCGKDYPVIVRLSISEDLPGGWTKEDTLAAVKIAEKAGADAIHTTSGNNYDLGAAHKVISPMYLPHGFLLEDIKDIKKAVNIPVIAVGGLTFDIAEQALKDGAADFMSFGRQAIADPYFVKKLRENRLDEIRVCLRCNSCNKELNYTTHIKCAINPMVGREAESVLKPAVEKKNILIAGAGPGGLEAAWVAGQRGHNVKLYEKTGEFGGGQIRLSLNIKGKEDMRYLTEFYEKALKKLDNIKIIFNTEVDRQLIEKENPDIVIIATGAKPLKLNCPGADRANVVSAFDALAGNAKIGDRVVVAGGGLIGLETAHSFAEQGRKVTIVEMLPAYALALDTATRFWLTEELGRYNAAIMTSTTVKEITEKGVIVVHSDAKEEELQADSVIVAVGTKSDDKLEKELAGIEKDVYTIGDAKEARKIMRATAEAYHLAKRL